MELPWDWPKEQMLRTQWWPRLMKTSISQSRKLQVWLELPKHVDLHMSDWWPPNRRIQYLKPWSGGSLTRQLGSKAPAGRWCKNWGREHYSPRVEEANTPPRSPLPSSPPKWWVGRGFAICSPHGSMSNCIEWMSLRCWTSGSAADAVLATWLVLVVGYGCTDAEGDQQLWAMHAAWRQSGQGPNVTHHCYYTFGVATCWFFQH